MKKINFDGLIPDEIKDDVKIYSNCRLCVSLDGEEYILTDNDNNVLLTGKTYDDDEPD